MRQLGPWPVADGKNTMRINAKPTGGAFTDPRDFIYANCPPHKKGMSPAGSNEAFADGSAQWRTFDSWYRYTYWSGAYGQTFVYWSQEITDFDSTLVAALPSLK